MQGARANYLRKVEKMQKIYELSIGICTSDRRIYLLISKKIHFATKIGIFEKMASETA